MSETHKIVTDVTYSELVALIGSSGLEPGCYYRITDFATKHYMLDGDGDVLLDGESNPVTNTGTTEPLTILALGVNKISHEAKSENYPQDIIHYDWNPDNWLYDLAFAAYDEAVLTGFKGVIYFRHDTINDVYMGHDFRNVLNRRWEMDYDAYNAETTYGEEDIVQVEGDGAYISMKEANTGHAVAEAYSEWWTKIIDYSITSYVAYKLSLAKDANDYIDVPCFYSQEADQEIHYNREVCNVHLGTFRDNVTDWYALQSILSNNVFAMKSNSGWYQVMQLEVDANGIFINNTFLGFTDSIKVGTLFYDNIVGDIFCDSVILFGFASNIVRGDFKRNHIGLQCLGLRIGEKFHDNTLGQLVSELIIGNYCQNNIIEDQVTEFIIPSMTGGHNKFHRNCFKSGINGSYDAGGGDYHKTNFDGATHVFATYNCDIMLADNGDIILSYVDEDTGNYTLTFVSATA